MQKEKVLVPKLRFSEYEGKWNKKNLEEVCKMKAGKFISASKIKDDAETNLNPCYGGNGLRGYASSFTHKGLYSLIGRQGAHCGNIKLVDGQFHATEHAVVVTPKRNINTIWLYYALNRLKLNQYATGQAQPGISVSNINKVNLKTPESELEQQKIANFLTSVDHQIQTLEKKKSLLELYKKGVLQKIFKQELRFKDEGGNAFPEWSKKKLGDLTYKVGRKNKENIQYPIYSINNQEGFRPQSEQFEGLDSNDRGYDISLYKIVHKETFAYNPARINVGSIGYSYDLNEVIISSLYVCFKTNKELEDLYLLAYLDTDRFNKDILRYEEGGVRQYLFYENFSRIKIPLPSNEEQTKIANFLSAIDKNIALVNTKIEHTKSYKKGLLQQMFV